MRLQGTRIERLWVDYIEDCAPEDLRQRIAEAPAPDEQSGTDLFWDSEESFEPKYQIALHVRLISAPPSGVSELGIDLRGLELGLTANQMNPMRNSDRSVHAYLDDMQVEILERALASRLWSGRLKSEERVSVLEDRFADMFLPAQSVWPRDAAGRSLPLGAAVRVSCRAFRETKREPDGPIRFISLKLTASTAEEWRRLPDEAEKSVIVLHSISRSLTSPDGATWIARPGKMLWGPARVPQSKSDEHDLYLLVSATVKLR